MGIKTHAVNRIIFIFRLFQKSIKIQQNFAHENLDRLIDPQTPSKFKDKTRRSLTKHITLRLISMKQINRKSFIRYAHSTNCIRIEKANSSFQTYSFFFHYSIHMSFVLGKGRFVLSSIEIVNNRIRITFFVFFLCFVFWLKFFYTIFTKILFQIFFLFCCKGYRIKWSCVEAGRNELS